MAGLHSRPACMLSRFRKQHSETEPITKNQKYGFVEIKGNNMAKAAQAVKEEAAEVQDDSKKQAQSVEFSETAENDVSGSGGSVDILLDMNIPITVVIGQTEITVRRLLHLGPGSVLKLSKSINETIDLFLSDTKFATGSVVVVDGRFAVKINQIHGVADSAAQTNEE